MNENEAKVRVEALRDAIRRHDHLYYVLDRPEISDAAYDTLFKELEALEERFPALRVADSPTQRVGGVPLSTFPTVEHAAPMLSLDSDASEESLRRFVDRVRKAAGDEVRFALEPKLDGLSIEVVFENGLFVRAATRGDGVRGEGVTENVRTIRAMPLRLRSDKRPVPRFLSVRGEVILRVKDFERLNERLLAEGKEPVANPRNAAAGSLRQLDARVTASRPLDVYFYDILDLDGDAPPTQTEVHRALADWGLRVSELFRNVGTADEILAFHRELEERRDALEFEIDGIVIKVDEIASHDRLGTTARHPRWAYAHKFPPRKEVTRVLAIVPSVGRTGVVTPIAMLRPVQIGGVTVSRASLHNREEVRRKDVREGDTVRVQRAGDVIPQVVEVVEVGTTRGPAFEMPSTCPSCGSTLTHRGPFTICTNGFQCRAQQAGRLQHFASRPALDIEGLGEETARLLVDTELVRRIPDLFNLRAEQLMALEGFAEVSANKLIANIAARAAGVELHRFVYGLGIPEVGEKVARDLAEHFGSLEALRAADAEALIAVRGVGPRMSEQILAFFGDRHNAETLDELSRRVRIVGPAPRPAGGALEGKTFVFTGSLDRFTRRQAKQLVEGAGGRVTSSVSRETSFVVVGADPGSKHDDAQRLGVTILSEDEFAQLLAEQNVAT